MDKKFYKIIIEESPVGYGYNRAIPRQMGIPCDYYFLEVNPAFVISRNVSDIFPSMGQVIG